MLSIPKYTFFIIYIFIFLYSCILLCFYTCIPKYFYFKFGKYAEKLLFLLLIIIILIPSDNTLYLNHTYRKRNRCEGRANEGGTWGGRRDACVRRLPS